MIKNIIKNIIKIVIFIFIYLLQIYVVNNNTLFGVKGDLCLMALVITVLIESNINSYVTAVICGLASDILFSPIILKHTVIYVIVCVVLIGIKKMYKQDSKMSIIIFSVLGTVISQIIFMLFSILGKGEFVNIFSYIFLILKESIVNVFLAFFVYIVFKLNVVKGEQWKK